MVLLGYRVFEKIKIKKIFKPSRLPEYANLALYGELMVLSGYRVFEKIKIKNS